MKILMRVRRIIWLPEIENKLFDKHQVLVEEVLFDNPRVRFVEKGHREIEDLYTVLAKLRRGTG